MVVWINGEERTLASDTSIADLLRDLGYRSDFVAVAINNECVKRASFQAHIVRAQDQIEILAPMAGG
ncbi:MAG: sulfur carrier protein ThiS [Oligoflexales bacterium]